MFWGALGYYGVYFRVQGVFWGAMRYFGVLGCVLGCTWGCSGLLWGVPRVFWGVFQASRCVLGARAVSGGVLVYYEVILGCISGFKVYFGVLWHILGYWVVLWGVPACTWGCSGG